MSLLFNVNTQGISQDLKQANGDYDTTEWGQMPRDKLEEFLTITKEIKLPTPGLDEDLCPAHVMVEETPVGLVSIMVGDGTVDIYEIGDGGEGTQMLNLSPREAVQVCAGELKPQGAAPDHSFKPVSAPPPQPTHAPQPVQQGPGKARRFIGNTLSWGFIGFGILVGIQAIQEEQLGGGILAVVIFGGLAWFSRRFIGGIKKRGQGTSNAEDGAGAMTGIGMAHMMNSDDYDGGDDGGYDGGE